MLVSSCSNSQQPPPRGNTHESSDAREENDTKGEDGDGTHETTTTTTTTTPPTATTTTPKRRRRRTVLLFVMYALIVYSIFVNIKFVMITEHNDNDNDKDRNSSRNTPFQYHSHARSPFENAMPLFIPPTHPHAAAAETPPSTLRNRTRPITTTTTTTTATTMTAACLLIMDDNHYLVEWLAYHYYTVQLRRVIILVDPNSRTSPQRLLQKWTRRGMMNITVWTSDQDYLENRHDFDVMQRKIQHEFREMTPDLLIHRTRQRLFYTQCLRTFKHEQQQQQQQESDTTASNTSFWTLLIDVDEFVRINYQSTTATTTPSRLPRMQEAGAVATVLQSNLTAVSASPCVQIPRLKFNSNSSSSSSSSSTILRRNTTNINNTNINNTNTTINTTTSIDRNLFLTQRYTHHTRSQEFNYQINKISKAILDLSRIADAELHVVDSLHLPNRQYCAQKNLYTRPADSVFLINHYIGSYDQFMYRDQDARNSQKLQTTTKVNVRDRNKFRQHQQLSSSSAKKKKNTTLLLMDEETDDEIRPWLDGFLNTNHHDQEAANAKSALDTREFLLEGVGQLEPKSWYNARNHTTHYRNQQRCALLFFGLPRSYKSLVLPSIQQHILVPNARHTCDVYVHYYQQSTEDSGRRNRGGPIHPDDIFLLKKAVDDVAQMHYKTATNHDNNNNNNNAEFVPPIVSFAHDTPEQFYDRRSEQIERYRDTTTLGIADTTTTKSQTRNATIPQQLEGQRRKYFPWAAKSYTNTSLVNIVKQWHSIECVFKLMDVTTAIMNKQPHNHKHPITYNRIGMFRSDALYVTPIDIASLGVSNSIDGDNIDESDSNPVMTSYFPKYDVSNHYFVTPGFAMNPVNDRIVYGPYDAIKIWATKRFDLIEERAEALLEAETAGKKHHPEYGYTMHSERFLNASVFPVMEQQQQTTTTTTTTTKDDENSYEHVTNNDICFLRTRADGMALLNDCSMDSLVPTPHTNYWNTNYDNNNNSNGIPKSQEQQETLRLSAIEKIVDTACNVYQMSPKWKFVGCGPKDQYKNWGKDGTGWK